jgi:glycosyltransferase involved in cell wall biosynthesis
VLGTPVGATPELLRPLDPSLVADGTDAGSLAAAIDTLLRNGLEELRAEARRYASERLSWNQAIERWEEALEEAAR